MVRKHGWQLPAHTFQVVAVTVYCLLVVAFYAFFAPFLGGRIWEDALVATYSPVALIVFVLYVRCTAINPADPGIMFKFDSKAINGSHPKYASATKELPRIFDDHSRGDHSSPSVASVDSIAAASSSKKGSLEAVRINAQLTKSSKRSSCNVGGILCALFVHEDCRKQDEPAEQDGTGEDALFCTLCNAEVRKFSKHCRSCDKCVDGFDHHCRWLNNCVGYKNYVTFISLMATSSIWLFFEAGVGIAVLVRCFVNKKTMESEIVDRLGNGFSRAPFATVVAICTAVSMLACVPLGELFFFHMILIRKGITTYEYVVAMRAMSEAPAGASVDEELPSILYSPTGSGTTGYSGGSSIGLQYKWAWCTPPRVFVDYKEEVAPHLEPGMVPSTIDPDAVGIAGSNTKATKKPVRISAWKLAKLDSNEAVKAAAKARASSSVLRPVDNQRLPDVELSSSGNMSVRSSMSTDTGGANKDLTNELRLSPYRNSLAPSHGSRDDYETGTHSASSFSSPNHVHESVTLSPLPPAHGLHPSGAAVSGLSVLSNTTISKPTSAGFDKSIAHINPGFDQKLMQKGTAEPLLLPAPATSAVLLRDVKRTSVVWDQEAGRYVSIPVSALEARSRPSFPVALSNRQAGSSTSDTRPADSLQDPSQLPAKNAVQQSENLMYTGESIFYGGPLFSGDLADNLRNDRASGSEEARHRVNLALPRESRFKRDAASNQLPVFIPTNYEQNPSSGSHPK